MYIKESKHNRKALFKRMSNKSGKLRGFIMEKDQCLYNNTNIKKPS